MGKRKPREPQTEPAPAAPFNPAFAGLEAFRAKLGSSEEPEMETLPTPEGEPDSEPSLKASGKLVVRKERKGRGGKTVTRIDGFPAESIDSLNELARTLAKALGCGASVEDGAILLQGSQSQRTAEWLRGAGFKRVIVGDTPPSRAS